MTGVVLGPRGGGVTAIAVFRSVGIAENERAKPIACFGDDSTVWTACLYDEWPARFSSMGHEMRRTLTPHEPA